MEIKSKKKKNINIKDREIKILIEKLTHSGNDSLHVDQLKRIKCLCSESNENVEVVFNELLKLLEKKHSEVRFSTVQLCDELFMNNDTFRTLFIRNLLTFLKYTIDEVVLPPPKIAAKKLIKLTITCVDKWNNNFGNSVYRIRAAYNYLKSEKNVDFKIKEIIDPKKRMEENEKERAALLLNKQHLCKLSEELQDMKSEIDDTITSLETCFNILLPSPEEFDTDSIQNATVEGTSNDFEMRLFGVIDPRHSVQIEFNSEKIEIKESEENSAILNAAKESYAVITNRFLPKTRAWVELLRKVNGKSESDVTMMKQALNQESKLSKLETRYNMLKIIPQEINEEEEVSSDSDLEDVLPPKPDKCSRQNEEEISFLSETLGISKKSSEVGDVQKQNNKVKAKNEIKKEENKNYSDRKRELLKVAPKLPYDIDLYHWEDEKLPTPTILAVNNEGARFWSAGASDEISELPIPGGSSVLRTRVIEFSGKFEPVERACKFPLRSDKLCPRRDRIKCPFHGLIVERDDKGRVINEEDKQKIASEPVKPETPEWQDPKLLAEIKAATGIDLKMPEKGKRKRKQKYPGLTDLDAIKKNSKARLTKKIFNKASLKRVSQDMNNLEHKKHRDKFGDQFHYVHETA